MNVKRYAWILASLAATGLAGCDSDQSAPAPLTPQERAADLLSRMTLEEKVGQVIQADISAVTPEEAREYNLGSVLNGGNSAPGGGKVAPAADWIALADAFWTASTDTSDGGVGVPIIWGTDAVHGHNNLQDATIFPHNSGLGATRNPDLIRQIGAVTAREIRATGLDWTFAPTLAVARDDRWGRAYESYSENPEVVASYASAMVEGLQGALEAPDFLTGDHVVATAKHFVGDGGTDRGIDRGDAKGDEEELLAIHAAGYGPAIDAGVQTIMASFSSFNGAKMHGSSHFLTDILRGRMGFDGFVVGDWNGHGEVPGCTPTDCALALESGLDMYMAPDSWKGLYESLLRDARSGDLDMARLDEAVTRILTVKFRTGLFDAGKPSERASADPALLGTPDHRAVARQAVRESLVLLKNSNAVLPLKGNARIMVTGSGADSLQQQTGGWTLNWQGDGNPNDIFGGGETIFGGIRAAVEAAGGVAFHAPDASFDTRPDVALVVFGEQPYAEYRGDRTDLVFEFDDGENLALIRSLKDQNIPVVSVFLTGRPLWVNPHINASDAFVVAWLPGTEGAGVADVLVGDATGAPRHDFKGTLSFSWPADGRGQPINSADADGVLFPFGYGLTYKGDAAGPDALSEEPGVEKLHDQFDGQLVSRGDSAAPFMLYLGDPSNDALPVTTLTAESLSGAISVRGTDYRAQEDARTIRWNGDAKARFAVRTDRPIELARVGDLADLALVLTLRVEEAPAGPVHLGMGCGDGCGGTLDISDRLAADNIGTWGDLAVPLTCFVEAGLDVDNLKTGLALMSGDAVSLSLHAARIATAEGAMACPAIVN